MNPAPWVIVAGGFHRQGGMDRANLALAEYLLDQGVGVHLVGHSIDDALARNPLATVHSVPRLLGSTMLGEFKLDSTGRAVAREVVREHPGTRVVVNGGNCLWGDVNWVHCVHHAWPCFDSGTPAWFRAKNRTFKAWSIQREARALTSAKVVLANSDRTKRDLAQLVGVKPERIQTIPLGAEAGIRPPSLEERDRVRSRFPALERRPLVMFVGAMSHDRNKGFDTLWSAWTALCKHDSWDAHLAVVGGGSGLESWKDKVRASPHASQVSFLGFSNAVSDLLAGADLLVSPVRYEAYGLNVHEAICRGVPTIVSASAGIAERFPAELHPLLLRVPDDGSELASRLMLWRANIDEWKAAFRPLGNHLRSHTWEDMARDIVCHVGGEERIQGFQTTARRGNG